MPVYNAEDYLDRCVKSILVQTYDLIELILVDDGSSDRSGWLCDEYAKLHSKVKVIHQKNTGQGQARNAGIRNTDADYIVFVDNDDMLPDQSVIEDMMAAIQENDILIGETGITKDLKKGLLYYNYKKKYSGTGGTLCALLKAGIYTGTVWAKLYKRELFVINDIFFRGNLICEDEDITPRLLMKAKKIGFIEKNCYERIKNFKSQTNTLDEETYFRKAYDRIKVAVLLKTYMDDENLTNPNYRVIYKHICGLYMQGLFFIGKLKEKTHVELMKKVIYDNKEILKDGYKYFFVKYFITYLAIKISLIHTK